MISGRRHSTCEGNDHEYMSAARILKLPALLLVYSAAEPCQTSFTISTLAGSGATGRVFGRSEVTSATTWARRMCSTFSAPVYRTRFIAVQVIAGAGKSDEVPHVHFFLEYSPRSLMVAARLGVPQDFFAGPTPPRILTV